MEIKKNIKESSRDSKSESCGMDQMWRMRNGGENFMQNETPVALLINFLFMILKM